MILIHLFWEAVCALGFHSYEEMTSLADPGRDEGKDVFKMRCARCDTPAVGGKEE